ncbi:MAG: hypothetical protein JSR45_13135 [Proteobacteria bacterium]|nr:hypothetical protein [Pseudomonadota bacterium]
MKLAVIARYFSLNEAQVVGSLLRACGFQASVADETYGSVNWTAQPFLNGFRVCVPWDEAADAVAVLQDAAPPPAPLPKPPLRWSFVPLLFACFWIGTPIWGWVTVRTLPNPWKIGVFAVGAAALALLPVLMLLLKLGVFGPRD